MVEVQCNVQRAITNGTRFLSVFRTTRRSNSASISCCWSTEFSFWTGESPFSTLAASMARFTSCGCDGFAFDPKNCIALSCCCQQGRRGIFYQQSVTKPQILWEMSVCGVGTQTWARGHHRLHSNSGFWLPIPAMYGHWCSLRRSTRVSAGTWVPMWASPNLAGTSGRIIKRATLSPNPHWKRAPAGHCVYPFIPAREMAITCLAIIWWSTPHSESLPRSHATPPSSKYIKQKLEHPRRIHVVCLKFYNSLLALTVMIFGSVAACYHRSLINRTIQRGGVIQQDHSQVMPCSYSGSSTAKCSSNELDPKVISTKVIGERLNAWAWECSGTII